MRQSTALSGPRHFTSKNCTTTKRMQRQPYPGSLPITQDMLKGDDSFSKTISIDFQNPDLLKFSYFPQICFISFRRYDKKVSAKKREIAPRHDESNVPLKKKRVLFNKKNNSLVHIGFSTLQVKSINHTVFLSRPITQIFISPVFPASRG